MDTDEATAALAKREFEDEIGNFIDSLDNFFGVMDGEMSGYAYEKNIYSIWG
ncbi:MAG: hypothetical protein IJY25_01005 [Bacilli bacterium]|nr:hypothetical protein [Bacilli bacterium]